MRIHPRKCPFCSHCECDTRALKSEGCFFLCCCCLHFFKHAVNFCEVTYTWIRVHLYWKAKYIDIWGNNWFSIFIDLTSCPSCTASDNLHRKLSSMANNGTLHPQSSVRCSFYVQWQVTRPILVHFDFPLMYPSTFFVFCKKKRRKSTNTTVLWTHYMWADSDNSAIYCWKMKLSCVRWLNWWEWSPTSAITDNLHCCVFRILTC